MILRGYFLHSFSTPPYRANLKCETTFPSPIERQRRPSLTGGGLKPREIASDNEDGAGWIEKATTLPTQVAAQFFLVPT